MDEIVVHQASSSNEVDPVFEDCRTGHQGKPRVGVGTQAAYPASNVRGKLALRSCFAGMLTLRVRHQSFAIKTIHRSDTQLAMDSPIGRK